MFKELLTSVYDIRAEDIGMDEVLYIKMTDKRSGFAISLFGLYIPPETSSLDRMQTRYLSIW